MGSLFWRFQVKLGWPPCFWECCKTAHGSGEAAARQNQAACFVASTGKKEEDNGVPQWPFKAWPHPLMFHHLSIGPCHAGDHASHTHSLLEAVQIPIIEGGNTPFQGFSPLLPLAGAFTWGRGAHSEPQAPHLELLNPGTEGFGGLCLMKVDPSARQTPTATNV